MLARRRRACELRPPGFPRGPPPRGETRSVDTLTEYGIFAVFAALLLAPFGLPIPEDISLLAAGVLVHHKLTSLPLALALGYLGVVIGDVFVWFIGNRVGLHPRGVLSRRIGPRQIRRIRKFYLRFGHWTVVICRNIPGMRFPAFFFAGATQMPLRRFLLLDGIAAVVTVLLYVGLGFAFGDEISSLVLTLNRFRTAALVAASVVILWLILSMFRKDEPLSPDEQQLLEDWATQETSPGRCRRKHP